MSVSLSIANPAAKCRFDPEPNTDQTVCHCRNVSESTLQEKIDQHDLSTVKELADHTDAGTGCQACHCRMLRLLAGLPAKCSGRFDFCGQCGCLEVNCACAA